MLEPPAIDLEILDTEKCLLGVITSLCTNSTGLLERRLVELNSKSFLVTKHVKQNVWCTITAKNKRSNFSRTGLSFRLF